MHILELFEDAFSEWFGDSKIVDAAGNPLKLYRGVHGPHASTAEVMEPRDNYAMFFSTSPHVASTYATPDVEGPFADQPEEQGAVFPVFIKAHSLAEFPVRNGGFDKFAFDRRARSLRPGEALVARQVYDIGPRHPLDPERRHMQPSDIYAIGRGTSVKSAIGNNGKFNGNDPRLVERRFKPLC